MGRYTSFYIEYKNKNTGKWNLVDGYSKLNNDSTLYSHDRHNIYNINGTCEYDDGIHCDNEPKIATKNVNDKFYHCVGDSTQGIVRDVLSGDHDAVFNDRGFPVDMSDELKNHLQRECNFYEIDDGELGYGKSYATLDELMSYGCEHLKNTKIKLEELKNNNSSDIINDKLDYIIKRMSDPNAKQNKKGKAMDKDEYEGWVADYEDEIDDWEIFNNFVIRCYAIADFLFKYLYLRLPDVRIVYFTS